ncbi:hypothetical protein Lesp02_70560 [Lentzea sp. NBRC 105346]|uniref:hypothetical protein n=1 Tax=Lentzea sp. NBRC 105346 TaxID=3032205 RepID=UPI0024A4F9EA|nr:hypothetical protein [Lentzea sp. NBRC 105346]GLZ34869.1 hypothetical protein Lesp02_70560 [Lentzea sp. NBRC 105346]
MIWICIALAIAVIVLGWLAFEYERALKSLKKTVADLAGHQRVMNELAGKALAHNDSAIQELREGFLNLQPWMVAVGQQFGWDANAETEPDPKG